MNHAHYDVIIIGGGPAGMAVATGVSAAGSKKITKDVLPCRLKRAGIKRRFGDIRELYGSLLTRTHSESEINFLHGRVSTGVFMRNYFNPAWISDLQERTLKAASEILAKIN